MTDAFPIFIGITGKRRLAHDPAQAAAAERRVRAAIAATLDHIEALLPDNRKVLLTGAALGTDLFVAEEALGFGLNAPRRNWLVLAVLPFETALFRQDFTAEEWATFERVVGDPRTRTYVLPPLAKTDGTLAPPSDLDRRDDATEEQRELRRRHYEQVGLWIADNANVLLAVMPSHERADRVGGTARIVAFRRGGRPDAVAAEVIAASTVLTPRADLHRPSKGYVWLIDPQDEPVAKDLPVTVLTPIPGGAPGAKAYAEPGAHGKADQRKHFRESKALLDVARFYVMDGHSERGEELKEWPTKSDPAAEASEVSAALRVPTNRAAARSRHAFHGLVGIFLAALLAFEIFVEFLANEYWALLTYIVFLAAIMLLYVRALTGRWQPIAEDRRAIREIVRVQIAWWQAGLDRRVDWLHLQGADFDLARVREAARNVILWALLACPGERPKISWQQVFAREQWPQIKTDGLHGPYPKDWIGNQYYYFRQREEQREMKGQVIDSLGWSLFMTAGFLALLLLLWLAPGPGRGAALALLGIAGMLDAWGAGLAIVACVAGACGFWWLRGRLWHEPVGHLLAFVFALAAAVFVFAAAQFTAASHALPQAGWVHAIFLVLAAAYGVYWLRWIMPDPNATHLDGIVLGLGMAVLLALALMAQAAALGHHELDEIGRHMTMVLVVFLPALAGAMRFLADKLAVEAEALSYREARHWYEHAAELLEPLRPGTGNAAADARAAEIVWHIGTLALAENEAWLKARRERPLSPLMGG